MRMDTAAYAVPHTFGGSELDISGHVRFLHFHGCCPLQVLRNALLQFMPRRPGMPNLRFTHMWLMPDHVSRSGLAPRTFVPQMRTSDMFVVQIWTRTSPMQRVRASLVRHLCSADGRGKCRPMR